MEPVHEHGRSSRGQWWPSSGTKRKGPVYKVTISNLDASVTEEHLKTDFYMAISAKKPAHLESPQGNGDNRFSWHRASYSIRTGMDLQHVGGLLVTDMQRDVHSERYRENVFYRERVSL